MKCHLTNIENVQYDVDSWTILLCSKPGSHARWETNFVDSKRDHSDRLASAREGEAIIPFKKEMEATREKLTRALAAYLVIFQTLLCIPLESIEVWICL